MGVTLKAEYSRVLGSTISLRMNSHYYEEQLLWQRLRMSRVCGHKHKYLLFESICQLSKTNVEESSLVPLTSPAMGLQPGSSTGPKSPPFCGVGLRCSQKSVGFPENSCTTIVPVGTSCLIGCPCSTQSLKLRKFLANFSPQLPTQQPLPPCKLSSIEETFSAVPVWFLCALQSRHVSSSTIGSYHLALVGNQGQWLKPVQFGECGSAVFLGQIHFQNPIFVLIRE